MSNDHVNPHFAVALSSFLPRRVESEYLAKARPPKPHIVFTVKVKTLDNTDELDILAPSWKVAIDRVLELLGIDDDCPADGIAIDCRPAGESK